MTQEDIYSNSVKCQELAIEKSSNEEELETLYEQWADLAEEQIYFRTKNVQSDFYILGKHFPNI